MDRGHPGFLGLIPPRSQGVSNEENPGCLIFFGGNEILKTAGSD